MLKRQRPVRRAASDEAARAACIVHAGGDAVGVTCFDEVHLHRAAVVRTGVPVSPSVPKPAPMLPLPSLLPPAPLTAVTLRARRYCAPLLVELTTYVFEEHG